jgi:hypothetical protein
VNFVDCFSTIENQNVVNDIISDEVKKTVDLVNNMWNKVGKYCSTMPGKSQTTINKITIKNVSTNKFTSVGTFVKVKNNVGASVENFSSLFYGTKMGSVALICLFMNERNQNEMWVIGLLLNYVRFNKCNCIK